MKRAVLAGLVAVLAGAAPASGQWAQFHEWDFCTANSLSVCMNFTLSRNGGTNDYRLRIEYVGTLAPAGQQGAMTSAGIYRAKQGEDLKVSNLDIYDISPSSASWSVGSNQLNGDGPITIEVAGNSDQGITNGLPVSGYVIVSFTSTNMASYDLENLYARSHIQGFGEFECSLKPDSRAEGNLVDSVADIDARCGTSTEVVPEPITMVLVGSGLLGLGGVRARRRRRDELTDA